MGLVAHFHEDGCAWPLFGVVVEYGEGVALVVRQHRDVDRLVLAVCRCRSAVKRRSVPYSSSAAMRFCGDPLSNAHGCSVWLILTWNQWASFFLFSATVSGGRRLVSVSGVFDSAPEAAGFVVAVWSSFQGTAPEAAVGCRRIQPPTVAVVSLAPASLAPIHVLVVVFSFCGRGGVRITVVI